MVLQFNPFGVFFSAADLLGDREVKGPAWGQGPRQVIQPRRKESRTWAGWAMMDLVQDLFSLSPCPRWHLSLKRLESTSRGNRRLGVG